jgi:ribonuclease D
MRTPVLIDTPAGLTQLAVQLSAAERIALDVEGDGLYRYRTRLCTVQVATPDVLAIVDTLELGDLSALATVFSAEGPQKLLHDAAFDARLLRERGLPLGNVLDTSVCARFLGEPAQGLASLLDKHFGVVLPKDRQRADWGVRPLDDDAVRYLAGDVAHLHALAEHFLALAADRGILDEIAEECRYVLLRAADEPAIVPPHWTRVKGGAELPALSRAALRELCLVREEEAERRDVPAFKVFGNEVLLAVARRRPRNRQELRVAGGEFVVRSAALADRLLEAVRRGEAAGDVPADELRPARGEPPSAAERAAQRTREKALQSWRRTAAEARGVDPQVVLPGHCLSDLAERDAHDVDALRAVRGLGDVRILRDGDAILAVLATVRGGTGSEKSGGGGP